jgi:hypothetical protein
MYLVGVLVGGDSSLRNKPTTPPGGGGGGGPPPPPMHHHHLSTLLFVSDLLAHWNCSHMVVTSTFLSHRFEPPCVTDLYRVGSKDMGSFALH